MLKAWSTIKRSQAGFSPVEVLLAATIFGFLVVALSGAIIYGRSATASAGERGRAYLLAEEGTNALETLRTSAYSNLTDGTFGIAQSGGKWILSGSSDVTGIFTRQVTIATVDSKRKTITSTVSWPQGATTAQVSITTRLTNWIAAIKSAAGAILSGSLDLTGNGDAVKVATVGNYAYVVRNAANSNFHIVDVSNSASPTLISTLSLSSAPTNIVVSGNFAYVTTSNKNAELQIVNITNPNLPVLVGTYNASGNSAGLAVAVSGNFAYLARADNGGNNEFVVVNITNPASPTTSGTYSTGGNLDLNAIYLHGNYAYVATNDGSQEVIQINITNPAAPTLAHAYNLATATTALAVTGFGNTLVVGQGSTLYLEDISNPALLTQIGTVATTGAGIINDISVDSSNKYLYLATTMNTAEFQVADITTPASPTIVRTVDVAGVSSTLYGVAYNSTLDIIVGASASDTQELLTFIKN